MHKILIFGNSASGKSTLAKALCGEYALSHLDLDTLAWQATTPPIRSPLNESKKAINDFLNHNNGWVIEGCYTDLLVFAESHANEAIFMNLCVDKCIANARNRPWESHKYQSKEAQDANLELLIEWISQYEQRTDTFSKQAHQAFYNAFKGQKRSYKNNER